MPLKESATGSCARPLRRAMLSAVLLIAICGLVTACTSSQPGQVGALPLTFVQDVSLPGGATRLDYQVIDPESKRLYIAHLGDGTVDVVDLNRLMVLGTVDHVDSAHGIAIAPDQHSIIASASGTNEAVIIDTQTMSITGRVPTGNTPDGIAYDPQNGRAYVSNEHDHVETVIDVAHGTAAGSIDIGGEAGNTIYDPVTNTVMVNVQSTNKLLTIDPATNRIINRTSLTGCNSNHGLYVNGAVGLAYVACEGNATLLVVDLRSHKTIARFDVGQTPDVLAYDTGLSRLYVASESGVVSVFQLEGRGLRKVGEAKLADGAHTVAVDQSTHRVLFPLENVNGKPVLRVMEPTELSNPRATDSR